MKYLKLLAVLSLSIIMFSGFSFGSFGESDKERRNDRISESKKAIKLLIEKEPKAKKELANAYGFASFKNYGMSMMMISADGGRGLAYNNKTKKITFMNMASGGIGIGLGAKEYFSIFIFDTKNAFEDFVEHGWEANTELDASIIDNDKGDTLNESHTIKKGIKLYKITKTGAIMQMNIHGSKYWKCKDLN